MRIRPRGKDRYELVWELGRDPVTGRRRQKSQIFHGSKKAAEAAWVKGAAALGLDQPPPTEATVGELAERWLVDVVGPSVRPNTLASYREVLARDILPRWGGVALAAVTAPALQAEVRQWQAAGRSRRTIQYTLWIWRALFRQAIAWGWIRTNPAEAVRLPRGQSRQPQVWTPEQARQFFAVADRDGLAVAWWLALFGGLRRSEILGLRWQDVDWTQQTVTIRQVLVRVGRDLMLGAPKSAAGQRTVALAPEVLERLRQHRVRQAAQRLAAGPAWHDTDLVVCTRTGGPVHPRNLLRRFVQLCDTAGVPRIRIHDLRHTHATWLVGELPLKTLAERLGHADPRFTARVYQHPGVDAQRPAAEHVVRLGLAGSMRDLRGTKEFGGIDDAGNP